MSKDSVKVNTDKFDILKAISMDACLRDGACSYSCPVFDETNDPITTPVWKCVQLKYLFNRDRGLLTILTGPRSIPKEKMKGIGDATYHCTLCGRCSEACVLGLPTRDLWETLRSMIFDVKYTPIALKELSDTIKFHRNPYGSEHSSRSDWIRYARLDEGFVKAKAELVYFVGCASSYKGIARRVPQAIAKILNLASEDWTLLGNDEWCCGNPSSAIGDEGSTRALAEHNVEEVERRGAKKIVFNCPGCLRNFKIEYPKILKRKLRFETYHITELIKEYILKGRIKLNRSDDKISYHDPCELSRLGGVMKEPRAILKVLTQNFVELPESGRDTRCCGGGGSFQVVDDAVRLKMGGIRIKQAERSDATILTSACPNCKITLGESARQRGSKIRIMDIVETVASQLKIDD